MNQTIRNKLMKMLEGAISAWDVLVPYVTHLYNTTVRTVSKSTPFALMLLRSAEQAPDAGELDELKFDPTHWLTHQGYILATVYPAIKESIEASRAKAAQQFSRNHRIVKPIPVGTRVFAYDTNRSSKEHPRYIGPFEIKSMTDTGAYILNNGRDEIRRDISMLKPIPLSPHDDDLIYTVKDIVGHSGSLDEPDKILYKVRWQGYTAKDDTWQTAQFFVDQKTITDYWAALAPKRATKKRKAATAKRKRAATKNTPRKRRYAARSSE